MSQLNLRSAVRILRCLSVCALIPTSSFAQATNTCNPPAPLVNYPQYGDNTFGWSPNDTPAQIANKMAIGDIDGDGNDELVALNTLPNGTVEVEIWHWSITSWIPMAAFPSQSAMQTSLAGGVPTQVHLADIDGSG
jgi:hypothetical protein